MASGNVQPPLSVVAPHIYIRHTPFRHALLIWAHGLLCFSFPSTKSNFIPGREKMHPQRGEQRENLTASAALNPLYWIILSGGS